MSAMSNPNPITNTATAIADQLGETVGGARATIWRTVRTLGPERAQAFVAQALEVEANGGMLLPDGSRRRTLGGVFFYVVRTQISDTEAVAINGLWRSAAQRRQLGVATALCDLCQATVCQGPNAADARRPPRVTRLPRPPRACTCATSPRVISREVFGVSAWQQVERFMLSHDLLAPGGHFVVAERSAWRLKANRAAKR